MQQIRSPYIRVGIHLLLIGWVLYSVTPFVWAIIGSFQRTVDAVAREPRFLPQVVVDNNVAIAVFLAVAVLTAYLATARSNAVALTTRNNLLTGLVAVILAGGFLYVTASATEDQIFPGRWENYRELWLNISAEEFAPVAIGLIALIVVLIIIGIAARRLPKYKTYIYLGIAVTIVGVILWLPNVVNFAEFYGFFLNSVIVTVGTVVISISIGCLAGYGLSRYSGIAGVIILFAALAFRALPRMAFILPYYYFAQVSGLYDTYPLLIITFVAINQPFTIWMLRSFFMEIPRELEEAAMIDGCNRLTAFVRVIVPIVWPGIITTSLFTMLLAYNEFLLVRLLTSTLWTLPVGISRFTSGEDTRLIPLSNASAVSITIPLVLVIIFFQRYLIKGLAGGAVKG
ncbi:MAG: carbohydrate ABC transporter permease [Anaerolineae bacterium]|nr:carbohydrate ABC transporter permease [Anaerolineae bacterium]